MQDILELERWDGQQSTLVYWVNKTLDKVNELVNAVNKDMAQTAPNSASTPLGNDCLCNKCAVRKRAACPVDNLC